MKIYLNYNDKKFNLKVKKCNLFEKFSGLMFTHRENAKALLFDFKKLDRAGIHSCFVFFPFVAVWLDDKNNIIEKKIVKPFNFLVLPKKNFNKLIEIPINDKYKGIVKLLCSQSHSVLISQNCPL